MTNEFAINTLEQYREKPTLVNEIETVEEAVWLDEALDIAIKALVEQEPSGDAISRQAVHIELEKWITYGEYKYSNATKYLYDRIDRLPPVNPQEPKTDTWSIKDVADTLAKHGLIVESEE